MKKLTIFFWLILFLFFSVSAIAAERNIKKELEDAKKAGQIIEHEKNIQQTQK